MSLMPSRLLVAALLFSVPALQSCDACGGKKKEALSKKKARKKARNKRKGKGKGKGKRKAVKKVDAGLAPQTGVAAAVHLGDQVLLWTEGRSSALGRKVADVSWSSAGFTWPSYGGSQVLAPGGAMYWHFGKTDAGQPLAEIVGAAKPAPEGYELTASAGRGGNYKLGLKAPGGRTYRLGMSRDTPKATAWLEGTLPAGVKATTPLAKDTAWPRGADGKLTSGLPEGLQAVEAKTAAPEKTAVWATDLQKIAGAEAKVVASMLVDLDRDGTEEALTCLDKSSGDYLCYVVDEVGESVQYHPVALPYAGTGDAPQVAMKGDVPYVVFAGKPRNAGETTALVGHAVYFDGGAYQVSLHR